MNAYDFYAKDDEYTQLEASTNVNPIVEYFTSGSSVADDLLYSHSEKKE